MRRTCVASSPVNPFRRRKGTIRVPRKTKILPFSLPTFSYYKMTKAHLPMKVPKAIKLPGAPEILTTIDGNGKHHIQCDLCGLDITLTVTAHPRSFLKHRHRDACLRLRRSKGLPDPEPFAQAIPLILVAGPDNQSEQSTRIPCPGHAVEWLPGSIWETYLYHQHEVRAVGWWPIAFNHEENEIVLQSDNCLGFILDTDEPPCKECWNIGFSNKFQEFLTWAKEAKDHTPWELLTAQQMCSLLGKMAATIKSLRTQVFISFRISVHLSITFKLMVSLKMQTGIVRQFN